MSVQTKPDGRIFCVYYDDEGRQVWESFGRKPGAREAAETRDLEIKLFKRRSRPVLRPFFLMTWKELLQAYMLDRKSDLKQSTRYGILYVANTYTAHLFNKLISSFTMVDCVDLETRMKARANKIYGGPLKNRTINTYMHYFKKVFDWAVDRPDIALSENPWAKRKNLRTRHQKFRLELFSVDELRAIIDHAPDHLAWAIEVAYYTGVRPGPSELFSLRWDDVLWDVGRLRVRGTKTAGAFRTIPLDRAFLSRARRRERAQRQAHPACPWICHYKGKQLSSVKRAWKEAKKSAGITRRIRIEDIRHYYITYALAGGMDIMQLAEIAGHADINMIVKVYSHMARDLRSAEATKLPDLHPRRGVASRSKKKQKPPSNIV